MDTIWAPALDPDIKPKYRAVVQAIREAIASGALSAGEKLPPVRELGWTLGMTPGTVARAYTVLTDEGVLRAEVGRGTFVAAPATAEPPLNLMEMDVIEHLTGGDNFDVNLFSPHLPNGGQSRLIRQLLAEVAKEPPSGMMHYPSRRGAKAAREGMVRWLWDTPIGPFSEADIVLSHGGQNAISLVFQTILKGRRPVIFVEELSYPGFRRAAAGLRADVVSIAMDGDGLCPVSLAAASERYPEAQIVCTSPEVHSPTCGYSSLERRIDIVAVARKFDLQILEDDCYRIGTAQAPGYRQLAPERGWYVSSLSKSITPALRVGCAIAPKDQTAALHRTAEHGYFGLATPITDLVASLLVHPQIDGIMERTRQGVSDYVKAAVNVLGAYDLSWREDVPFVWLTLPDGWRASAFCRAAETRGVRIRAAEEFAARHSQTPHAVRMAVNAGVSLNSFEAAMVRLRDLLDNPMDEISV
ncbi:PLP-dependent aminotransferase family protein [Sulfitobacter donghicola]|uniref:Aspartate aminotransferase n=1 Tax=Sulfitobacter donghicola DSW-25 = KCTC 12864 = JCM 14565 TaxID=1300350 RepID=A0A073IDE3_9RHOB|nr:PLP-dependent aminotransferase family protein [Sulfitobacter donghicola]KEJ88388.1 aspartate aminotransferase [Sulfitobacter donghicola DSW-25 = KCTC 12864 = JCM 14565]KIN69748.1 Transcriptional regulator, GntR family [Sulfitobacter donghicola DSW-25 = KCTC 12864 = JCM 14565]